jgi:DNA repair photolyase
MLYRTKVEYGDWAMNHVQGCAHGCVYPCYAYLMAKHFGRVHSYEEWLRPHIVDNTLELLRSELPKHAGEIKRIQLCFTTDPFMYGYPEIEAMSLEAVRLINSYNIPCVVLTKGILPTGLTQLSKINSYGITLVSLSELFRIRMEPGAAPIADRINSLRSMHDAGFKTWVSIEPYPTPNIFDQELPPILNAIGFSDRIVFGRTHYDSRTSEYTERALFYRTTADQVKDFCELHKIDCHIKKGTYENVRTD